MSDPAGLLGQALRLQVLDGATWRDLALSLEDSYQGERDAIDVTAGEDWRVLLAGEADATAEIFAVFGNAASQRFVLQLVATGQACSFRLMRSAEEVVSATGIITAVKLAGSWGGFEEYRITLKATDDTPAPVPLADPSKWVGFWLTGANSVANTITTAPGSTCDKAYLTYTLHTRTSTPVGPYGGFCSGRNWTNNLGSVTRAISTGVAASTVFTFGGWIYSTDTKRPNIVINDNVVPSGGSTMAAFVGDGTAGTMDPIVFGSGNQRGSSITVPSGTWTHLCARVDTAAKRVESFKNGVLANTLNYTISGVVQPANPGVRMSGDFIGNQGGFIAGMFLTQEALSNAAIAALAALRVPDAAGNLYAA